MGKVVKKSSVVLLMLIFIFSAFLFSLQNFNTNLALSETYEVSKGSDLFQANEGMRIIPNYVPKSNEIGNYNDNRSGVLLETNTAGAAAKFKYAISGNFCLDYRMLSYADARDINQLSFVFKDTVTNRFFELRLSCQNNAGWYNAKVFVDGQKIGYGVRADNGDASAVSSQGTYGQSSFSSKEVTLTNTSETADQPIGNSHTVGRIGNQILFNPDTMEIRVNSTGSRNTMKLVMDLDSEEHMAKVAPVLKSFKKYTVEIMVTEFLSGSVDSTAVENGPAGGEKRPGKILLYSLNRQNLGGEKLTDNAGPVLSIPKNKGVINEPYSINDITGYDVADGIIYYDDSKFEVYDKNNNKVVLKDGKFTPSLAGDYKIVCRDSSENSNITDFTYGALEDDFYMMRIEELVTADILLRKYSNTPIIHINEQRESVKFSGYEILNERILNYPNGILPSGMELNLPVVSAKDSMVITTDEHGWLIGSSECSVGITVEKNNTTIFNKEIYTYNNALILEEGAYIVSYVSKNQFNQIYKMEDISFTVSNNVPLITIPQNFPSFVEFNSKYQIPVAAAKVNNEDLQVATCIKTPKGREVYDISESFLFDELGKYSIKYNTTYGSIIYSESKEIYVATKAEKLFENIRSSEFNFNESSPNYATAKNGVLVIATRGNAAIKYKNVIDLSNSTVDDTLLQFMVIPQERGSFDFSVLRVTLTDIHNSRNYIEIQIKRNRSPQYKYTSFISAGTNGNILKGVTDNGQVRDQKQQTTVCPSGFYGFGFAIGDTLEEGINALFGNLHYDNESKQLWVTRGIEGSPKSLVLDLDNTNHVGPGNEWDGFTTGEVYMTIQAEDLSKSTAAYMLTMINNQSLSGDYIVSSVPSRIIVDMAGNKEIPVGIIGKPYKIFDAYAYNQVDGRLDCGFKVVYNEEFVAINGNTFTPLAAGNYQIIYTLNNNEKVLDVIVKESTEVEELKFNFDAKNDIVKSAYVGEYIFIPTNGITSGGSGNKDIKYSVKLGEKDIQIDSNGKFKVSDDGIYVLTVALTDYLGQNASFNFNITATYNEDPIFESIFVIPDIVLLGKEYKFPNFTATQYIKDSDPHTAVVEMNVIKSNGELLPLTDDVFIPLAEYGENIKLQYAALRKDGTATKAILEYNITVLNPYDGLLVDKKQFFYTNSSDADVSSDLEKVALTANSDTVYNYAAILPAHEFNMEFIIPAGKGNFKTLRIIMRDSLYPNIVLQFNIQKNSQTNSYFYINNETYRNIIAGSFGTADSAEKDIKFKFKYLDKNKVLINDTGKIIGNIQGTLYGEEFNGFSSGKIYLDIEFIDVESQSKLNIDWLCGQAFNNQMQDRKSPTIQIYGSFPKDPKINEVITIPKADSIDVLDPNSNITLTVKGPDNSIILNSVDINNDVDIQLTKYGCYSLNYVAKDSSGRVTRFVKTITVYDLIAPVIKIDGNIQAEGKMGEIIIPSATVTDNNDNVSVMVVIIKPNGKMETVKDWKFMADMKGLYTLTYMSKDSSYSYDMKSFNIMVS